jgi:hypothetical protein
MPKAEVRSWENRGHLLHEEAPDEVAEAISAFLNALPKTRKTMSPRGHVENQ